MYCVPCVESCHLWRVAIVTLTNTTNTTTITTMAPLLLPGVATALEVWVWACPNKNTVGVWRNSITRNNASNGASTCKPYLVIYTARPPRPPPGRRQRRVASPPRAAKAEKIGGSRLATTTRSAFWTTPSPPGERVWSHNMMAFPFPPPLRLFKSMLFLFLFCPSPLPFPRYSS